MGLAEMMGGGGLLADQIDDVREMIYDNNPIYVGVTIIVSLLHSVFEMLAIKNGRIYIYKKNQFWKINFKYISPKNIILDIQYWRNFN